MHWVSIHDFLARGRGLVTTLSFGIVIPTLNSAATLPETLSSISSQIGDNPIHVHVQDGGSTDATVTIAKQWAKQLPDKHRITFSIDSRPDGGPGEALNRGFTAVNSELMSWIGADDIFMPNALVTVASFLQQFPEFHWVTGVAQQINETGVTLSLRGAHGGPRIPTGFSQWALSRGHHANALAGFIQQEGTFWTSTAWHNIGENVATDISSAFDFDLWCKMAKHHELVQLAIPLAAFRKRRGQISENHVTYASEVQIIRKRLNSRESSVKGWGSAVQRPIAFFDPEHKRWRVNRFLFGPEPFRRLVEGMSRRSPLRKHRQVFEESP
jgi:glycosyltransferase involved in cell wall biosynthesis